jgi:nucleoid-associated protein YgaU
MSYGIELSFNNKQERIEIPVMPASIEISEGGSGKVYNVVGIGEIHVIKDAKLTEYRFNSLFPAQYYPFVHVEKENLLAPVQYVAYINKWMKTRHPLRFIVKSEQYDMNTPASIESFEWKEVAGSQDIAYRLKLKQYVFYAAKPVKVKSEKKVSKPKRTRPHDRRSPKTCRVRKNDSLWAIAKRTLGDSRKWKEIKKLNNLTDAEIKNLKVGRTLKLPVRKK